MYLADQHYIQALAQGLKGVPSGALEIIMGPAELKSILQKADLHDFLGKRPWINLHTHSNASDGQLSPVEWIKNAAEWMHKNHLMQYIIALTDHDTIDGLVPVLKYIVKNHTRLQGLRVVLGCELSVSFEHDSLRGPLDFEILHYGVNPFDEMYVQMLKKQAENRLHQLPILFDFIHQKYPLLLVDLKAFKKSSFYGANMQKGLGVNWLYNTMSYFKSVVPVGTDLSGLWDDLVGFGRASEKRGLWVFSEKWLQFIQKQGGFASLAHPYRLQLGQKLNTEVTRFIPVFFESLSHQGLDAAEFYYGNLKEMQAAFEAMIAGGQPANETDRWVQLIQNSCKASFPFMTGGSDNHDAFLGNGCYQNQQLCWDHLRCYWDEIQPLIEKGYHLLNKEVTLGLPGPCMPVFDEKYDLGIGSPYGRGAERVWRFWGRTIHKILLGPAGRTTNLAKHSPYVSDEAHPNPFFIPIEYWMAKGKITSSEVAFLRRSFAWNRIDFTEVDNNFNMLLSKVHTPSGLALSDFVDELAGQVKKQNKRPYIADMQVQIPQSLVEQNRGLFLDGFTLGTPPDDISNQPRNWGFPVFNPEKLFSKNKALGPAGQLWQHLIDMVVTGAKGGLRIDHFIGFVNPYVISTNPEIPNGRLYSSPDHPIFKKYAFQKAEQFYQIVEKILLPVLKKHHLTTMDLYPEDIGARPEQLDDVLAHFGLGRLVVAEFNHPNDPYHIYQLMKTHPYDVATLDTHDTPSIQTFFDGLGDADRYAYAMHLAQSLRFSYTDDLKSTEQLVRMQWAELLACPARRVQAFFTSWIGQEGRYNQPGNPDKWRLRCVMDFEELYFKNLIGGRAYNPLDAICLAIYARGDAFYQKNESFVAQLRDSETKLKDLICQWLKASDS